MGRKTETSFTEGNKTALKHGAEGTLRRIVKGLPLAEDDKRLHSEIISKLGYDPDNLPAGPLGYFIDLLADDLLLANRFKAARQWAAEQGEIELYISLSQKSGWRNDKASPKLLELMRLQASGDDRVIEAALSSAKGEQ